MSELSFRYVAWSDFTKSYITKTTMISIVKCPYTLQAYCMQFLTHHIVIYIQTCGHQEKVEPNKAYWLELNYVLV